jgi:hypothetical protein
MDDLLGELLAISREETTRAMQVISQKDEELRSVKEELKKVKTGGTFNNWRVIRCV